MSGKRPRTEDHAVLVREMVRRDGSRTTALRVFCPRKGESVPFAVCDTCPTRIEFGVGEEGDAVVRCPLEDEVAGEATIARSRHEALPGATTPVATVLRGGAICVGTDADLPALVALLAERSLPELFVVDDEGRLLGLVREVNVSRAIQFESTVSLPELPKERESGVYALMSTATAALESDSVRRALLQMAGAHLREIPVVTRDGQLLGVLRDVDGLRWIAAEQRAKR